jgi:hypothetical protein
MKESRPQSSSPEVDAETVEALRRYFYATSSAIRAVSQTSIGRELAKRGVEREAA